MLKNIPRHVRLALIKSSNSFVRNDSRAINTPRPGLRLAQPEGPTAGVCPPTFYLKTEEDTAFET
jgi:hypothetical protein